MRKKLVPFVISLMFLSLAGIILVQLFWIRNAYEVEERLFSESVNDALEGVASRTERDRNFLYVSDKLLQDSLRKTMVYHDSGLVRVVKEELRERLDNSIVYAEPGSSASVTVSVPYKSEDKTFTIKGKNKKGVFTNVIRLDSIREEVEKSRQLMLSKLEDSINLILEAQYDLINDRYEDIDEVFDKLTLEIGTWHEPPGQFLDRQTLQDDIRKAMDDKGVELPFEFAVFDHTKDTITTVRSDGFRPEYADHAYTIRLFPDDIIRESEYLVVAFPGKSKHIMSSMGLLLGGSLVFTLVILATFGITLFVILRQKKTSQIKTDFINNMTHEFKTPIATMSLALESIKNKKVISDPEKIRYFASIMEEENRRMNMQVENVLQMSLIDKSDFGLNLQPADVHEAIQKAVARIRLQVEKRNGEISCDLQAESYIIMGDPAHLINILANIIDNGNKYSPETPYITISTKNVSEGIRIEITDRGRGMRKEEMNRIFDKFYRIPTGNIHDVKGFGLGLSYVKAIVLALGGDISVKSEPGNGSTFILLFPLKKTEKHDKKTTHIPG